MRDLATITEYAGNIIPAIATTNAIIAAALVHQALNVLRGSWNTARSIWLLRNSERVFDVSPLEPPNPHCAVCRAVYVPVRIVEDVTLGELVKTLVGGEGEGKPIPFGGIISVQEGSRMLFESEDSEDNADKTLKELGIGVGKFVTRTTTSRIGPCSSVSAGTLVHAPPVALARRLNKK